MYENVYNLRHFLQTNFNLQDWYYEENEPFKTYMFAIKGDLKGKYFNITIEKPRTGGDVSIYYTEETECKELITEIVKLYLNC